MRVYVACRTVMPAEARLFTRERRDEIACCAYVDGSEPTSGVQVILRRVGNGPDRFECAEAARELKRTWDDACDHLLARCGQCDMPIRVNLGPGGNVTRVLAPCGHKHPPEAA